MRKRRNSVGSVGPSPGGGLLRPLLRTVRTNCAAGLPLALAATAFTAPPNRAQAALEVPAVERARYLMGTRCEARAFGEPVSTAAALDAALDRIADLEQVLTTYRDDGELARLNAEFERNRPGEPVPISVDLRDALVAALDWARRTQGRFDPTIGAASRAWGLDGTGRVPSSAELDRALRRVSWRLVELDSVPPAARCLSRGVFLDVGGFGKGYALDAAAAVLRSRGVTNALINFGGQVLAIGAPPGEPGWIVDVADPADRDRAVVALRVRDASVATSGNAERYFVDKGTRYGHLLDPRTGRPVPLRGSVTILAAQAAAADALSTALAVAGPAEAPSLLPRGTEFLYLERSDTGISATASSSLRERVVESSDIHWTSSAERGAREGGS